MEGPTSNSSYRETTKTTYKTRTEQEPYKVYKSVVQPRSTIIHRTVAGAPVSKVTRSMSYSLNNSSGMPSGSYQTVTSSGVANVLQSRDREKKDMRDLNERLASYIEKVRFLEAQNKKLADELKNLKDKWGKESSAIKAMYQAELDEARKLLDEAEKEKARLEIRCASLEEQVDELKAQLEDLNAARAEDRQTIDHQNRQLSDYEAEINLLRRRVEQLEGDRDRDKKEILRLQDALNRARMDLDVETLNHIDAENRRQTLEEELEFLKQVHEQEMKELAALAYRDTTAENRDFWKNEMGNALREIQGAYDDKLDAMRKELESYYNVKITEMRMGTTRQNMDTVKAKEDSKRLRSELSNLRAKLGEKDALIAQLQSELESTRSNFEERIKELEGENDELKTELAKMRAELEAILKELQDIMDTKLGLELEIAAYRKLLEGEETRMDLKQLVNAWSGSGHVETVEDTPMRMTHVAKGEMSAKTTFQRSAKGPVAISECAGDGKFIVLENTTKRMEEIGGWMITRVIDGEEVCDITLPKDFSIKPMGKSKIFSRSARPFNAGPNDIEASVQSFGIGSTIATKLLTPGGEEKASHIQKTLYSS